MASRYKAEIPERKGDVFRIVFETDNFQTFRDVEKKIRIAMDIEKIKEPFRDELAREENE